MGTMLNLAGIGVSGPTPNTYKHFSSAGSSQLATTEGALGAVFINTVGTTPVVNLYDEANGQGNANNLIATVTGGAAAQFLPISVWFKNGLYVVLTGSGFSITITWLN